MHTTFEVFCICPGVVLGSIRLIASLKHSHVQTHRPLNWLYNWDSIVPRDLREIQVTATVGVKI